MELNLKNEKTYEKEIVILCRRKSQYNREKVYIMYVIKEDGTPFYFFSNGCENMDGSSDCRYCVRATPEFLFNHPDTDLKKPFLPVFQSEENW